MSMQWGRVGCGRSGVGRRTDSTNTNNISRWWRGWLQQGRSMLGQNGWGSQRDEPRLMGKCMLTSGAIARYISSASTRCIIINKHSAGRHMRR